MTRDSLSDLESRRVQLEQNVAELRDLLRHWQTWEAEYEGFKEELQALGEKPSTSKIYDVAAEFDGELLTEDEIQKFLQDEKRRPRTGNQILGLLSRRIDYVQDNVKATQKRMEEAEDKLAAVNVVMQPDMTDDNGLPVTEITEVLDEEGNVISSHVSRPGDAVPQVLKSLEKAGLSDRRGRPTLDTSAPDKTSRQSSRSSTSTLSPAIKKPNSPKKNKGVRFDASADKPSEIPHSSPVERPSPTTVHEKIQESLDDEAPIIPPNETEEQVALRREMLAYNNEAHDIGAIVAEMDIDDSEGSSAESMTTSDSDEEPPEDSFGRTSVRVLSDDYRREMLELERKLDAKSMINAGPDFETPASNVKAEEEPSKRSPPVNSIAAENKAPPKRVSRFKAARAETGSGGVIQNGPLAGLSGSTLVSAKKADPTQLPTKPAPPMASSIVERPLVASANEEFVSEPDEFDPALMKQEIALEYQRLRTKFIQRENGFLGERNQDAEYDSTGRRMSRFRTARLVGVGN